MKDNISDFSSLVLSLASTTSFYLGEVDKKDINLNLAEHTIDTLEMLKLKTKGNLNKLEANLLDDILYKLRLKFLDLKKDER